MENKEMKERFDEKFPQLVEHKKLKRKEPIANYTHYWTLIDKKKSVLAFIQSEIDLAVANREKEIVKMIEEKRPVKIDSVSEIALIFKGYNQATEDIINLITKDK